jgi:ankyrin repeat protein
MFACCNRHLHVAQWLYEVSKEKKRHINISINGDYLFRYACRCGYLDLIKLLQSINPHLYEIIYDKNGKPIGAEIRYKAQTNWDKRKYGLFLSTNKEEPNLLYNLPTDLAKMVLQFV